MEYLSNRLTDYILEKGAIKEENYDIYQYGFQCFLEISISVICSIIIGLSLGMMPECILFFLFFIPMRSYSGGIHMETYFACLFFSCIILISALLAVKYLAIPWIISFLIYLICAIAIKIIGPVDHPNREVDGQENRLFIKRTDVTLFLSLVIAIVFILTNNTRYLFLESIVFLFIFITSLTGKIKYYKNSSPNG
jgi:accessory gene regulator B